MWVLVSEPLFDTELPEDADVFYRCLSFSNIINYNSPDEIFVFNTLKDAEDFDLDEYLKDFDWEEYKKRYQERKLEQEELDRQEA